MAPPPLKSEGAAAPGTPVAAHPTALPAVANPFTTLAFLWQAAIIVLFGTCTVYPDSFLPTFVAPARAASEGGAPAKQIEGGG
jgi:hypothetical protein